MSDARVIDLSVEVPGRPEQVWTAVATGPGISSWFVPHQVEEREGGSVLVDFGVDFGAQSGQVVEWKPPERVVFRVGAHTYTWSVQATTDDTCTVRLVNTGFGEGPDGEAELQAMTYGWGIFFENLRMHLVHFAGQSARAVTPTRSTPGPHPAAFSRLCAVLGVRDDLGAGDRFDATAVALGGVVAQVQRGPGATTYFLLLDVPAPGTAFVSAEGVGDPAAVSTYVYLYGPAGAAAADVWTPFLGSHFPVFAMGAAAD